MENLLQCMKKAKIGPTFVRKMGQFLKKIDKENDLNKRVCVLLAKSIVDEEVNT
jgi:hypothetical protein